MSTVLRILIVVVLAALTYIIMKRLSDPKRKLDKAYKTGQFYFYDDPKNPRQNFFVAFKGVIFEGEKYVEIAQDNDKRFTIFIKPNKAEQLLHYTNQDFRFVQHQVQARYPKAQISWISSIEKQLTES
jgi:hypothetical protein